MKLTKKAQSVLDRVNAGEEVNDIEEAGSWSCGDGFEYGLIEGGYIKPEEIIDEEDLFKVIESIKVHKEFKDIWEKISFEM